MKTVTAQAHSEEIKAPRETVVFSGPPRALRGGLTISNPSDSPLFVRSLALEVNEPALERTLSPELDVDLHLEPGESKFHKLRLALDEHTPPGEYETAVSIGGASQLVRLIVQRQLKLELAPARLHMVGVEPGLTHSEKILLLNRGNISVVVPSLKHQTTLDMDLVCRSLSIAFRERAADTAEATLDAVVQGIKKDLADWIELTVREAGQIVNPGESILLHLDFRLPSDIRPDRMYEGEVRIYDQLLAYTITQAPAKPAAALSQQQQKQQTKKRRKTSR